MNEIELANWFFDFDKTKDRFKWFFDQYFGNHVWADLMRAREEKNQHHMLNLMNDVWFALPDSRFNIRENPAGWKEFLNLIEQ